jgi:tetratricopeptide (TPR) repeat protein
MPRRWRCICSTRNNYVLIAFVVAVIIECAFTFWYVKFFGIPSPFAEDQIGILVAQIPSDKNSTHQQTYAQAIREIVKESPELSSHVSVRMLDRPLSSDPDKQQEQALALGHRLHATFVLRAIPVEGAEQVWLTVVKQEDFPKTEAYSAKIGAAQLPNLDRLELPRDVVLLARCALAMLQYDSGNYDTTIALLTDVLRSESLPDGAPSRPYLRFYLGNSYTNERTFSLAIQQYDLVLSEWTRDNAPMFWASAMANLAVAMMSEPADENRLQHAIQAMDLAAQVFEEKNAYFALGMIHINRSYAYRLKMTPDWKSNIETAINEADEAMTILPRNKFSFLWAGAMINRGVAYKDRLVGDRISNLEEAIRSADAASQSLKQGTYTWALAVNNKGVALMNLENADYAKNLQASLPCFESALEVFDRNKFPTQWSMVMLNLGTAYSRLRGPEHERQAIVFYKLSLEVRDRNLYPREWAEVMLGLSNAYFLGPSPNREADLKEAVKIAQGALQVVKPQENTSLWSNLSRVTADSLAGLGENRKALPIYDVLTKRMITSFRGEQAASLLYNRGNDCLVLARQHDRGLLQDAISSYDQALTFVSERDYPETWGMIMHNRGIAYLYLPEKGQQHLTTAIQSFDSELRVRSQDRSPEEWAKAMLSKGMALLAMHTKDDDIAAIQQFDQALEVFTRDRYPSQWSMAMRLRNKALGGTPMGPVPKAISRGWGLPQYVSGT